MLEREKREVREANGENVVIYIRHNSKHMASSRVVMHFPIHIQRFVLCNIRVNNIHSHILWRFISKYKPTTTFNKKTDAVLLLS